MPVETWVWRFAARSGAALYVPLTMQVEEFMPTNQSHLPLAMKVLDSISPATRGYELQQEPAPYDPIAQVAWTPARMGKTEPTTHSTISSTGVFNGDTDEGADDTGTD